MILYRLTGRCEKWQGQGMQFTKPTISANLTSIRSMANKAMRVFKDDNKSFRFVLQKLTMNAMDKHTLIDVFHNEDIERLVQHMETLERWQYQHDPELIGKEDV